MNGMRQTMGTLGRTAAHGAAAWLLAALVLGGTLAAAGAERDYFHAKGSQNGFVKVCREAGAAPQREGPRVVSCTKMDSDGASAAVPYIVQDLIAGEGHQEVPVGSPVGDEARALVVPMEGGTDFTLYVRSDSLIMHISVLLNEDDPIADP
jgi:hypothetical protein